MEIHKMCADAASALRDLETASQEGSGIVSQKTSQVQREVMAPAELNRMWDSSTVMKENSLLVQEQKEPKPGPRQGCREGRKMGR